MILCTHRTTRLDFKHNQKVQNRGSEPFCYRRFLQFVAVSLATAATVVIIGGVIHATAAVAATVAVTVTAAVDQKEYDNENPDDIIVIKNIAETVHKYPPFAIL